MSSSYNSYPKVYNLGHPAIKFLLNDLVTIEEKCDGSQFSMTILNGKLKCRSRNAQLFTGIDRPKSMFDKAINTAKKLAPILHEGWTYRAEYLSVPKHNTLAYNRIPKDYLILFDINIGLEDYLCYEEKKEEARRIGLEIVPLVYKGVLKDIATLGNILDTESILGGQKVEGIVIKNYERFGKDGKVLMGKYVSDRFRELHSKNWGKINPSDKAIKQILADRYKTVARWDKAIQHLKEKDLLTNSLKDIGPLIKELHEDIETECQEDAKDRLWKWARKDIIRGAARGLPEYYKNKLARSQFNNDEVLTKSKDED